MVTVIDKKKKRREEQLGFSEEQLEAMREERRRTPLSPDREVLKERVEKPVPVFRPAAPGRRYFLPDRGEVTAEEYQRALEIARIEAAGGRKAIPKAPTAEEILEQQEERREAEPEIIEPEREEVEELPPEELPPVTEPAMVEPSFFEKSIAEAEKLLEEGPLGEKGMVGKAGLVLSVLPGGGANIAGKAALNTAKVATATRTVKLWGGMLKLLKTNWKKMAKWSGIGYVLWTERAIGNIDSALSQVRESITLPVSLAATNPNRIQDAFDMVTDLENDVSEYESDVKLKENYSLTFKFTGRTRPIYQRIKKLRAAIDLAREQIARTAALGRVLTDEESIIMTNEMNQILNQMEKPSKFLGII